MIKRLVVCTVYLLACNFSFAQSIAGSVGSNTTVCSGTNSGFVTLNGHSGNVVRWQSSTTNGASWTNISNTTINLVYANLTTTIWYRAEVLLAPSPPNVSAFSTPAIITVDAPSSGTVSSSTAVCSGSNNGSLFLTGSFTSVASWDSSIDGGLNWIPIANTSTSQNYSNLTTTTLYRATVTNGTCPSVTASAATITVNPITVGGSVTGTTTVCPGTNNGTLTLSGNTGNIIRWQSSDDGGISWSNITNTTSIYNFSNLDETMNYRAVIQSGNCLIENSSPVTVTVSPPSDGGTLSSAADVCSGANNGTLSLTGYTGNILRWEKSIDGGTIWTSIVNTTDNYTYSNLTLTTIYRVVVQSGACTSANSVPVQITVSAPTIAGIISGNDTVCNGSNSGTLTLMGHTGSVVRWQSSDDAGLTWSNITNTTGITTYNFANITTTTNFRAVVQNGACPVINSSHDTITVLPVSDGGSLAPVSYSACSGINSGTILLSGQSGNILRWESSVNGGITWSQIANTNPSQSFNNIVATTLYRAVVQEGQCTAAYSALSTISVFPATVSGSITGSDTVCTGTNSGSLSLNGYTGSILNWEYSKNGGVTWTNISNTTANHNYTNLTATTQYRAIVQSGSCASANSSIGTIMVNPITIGGNVLSSSSVCDSTTTGMLTLSGHVGSILHWESSIDSGNTWATIANTSNTQMYNGITTAIMYKALVESPGCTSVNSTFATISLSIPAIASYSFSTSGTTAIFTNTSTSNGGTSFWDFGDNTSSTVASPAHTYVTTGTYTVQLIISDSCGSDTTVQIVSITGLNISEIYNNPNVSIYPNPFSNAATIEMSFDPTASTLKIFDVYGKEVRNINLDPGTKALKLERENLLSGIYFYKIESPHEIIATGKIVIQ